MTPQDFSLAGLWKDLPIYGFFAFAFSFLGICLAIGIFRCVPLARTPATTTGCHHVAVTANSR